MSEAEDIEKKKPGPAPVYGPRKMVAARVEVEEWKEFKANCKEAGLSASEALAFMIKRANAKKRKEREASGVKAPVYDGPPVKDVQIVVLENHGEPEAAPVAVAVSSPSPPDTSATLWGELLSRMRPKLSEEAIVLLEACAPVSYSWLRLTLAAPTPYIASDLQERIGGLASSIATDLVGELVEVVWVVSADYERRMAEAERRAEEREAQRDQEDFARKSRAAQLTALYAKGDAGAAKEAGVLLVEDASLLSMLPAPSRKLITDWIGSTRSGADYQTAKESEYRGPKRGRR